MALSRDLTVRLLADTSDLNAGINKASSPMNKLTGTVGKLAGGFVALGAATVAVDFLGEATKAAEEDKKSQALLANQLKETNNATDAQIATVEASIDALSRASGVADDELRPAYAALARSTGDTEEANRQLALAMDIAAGRGVPLETVTKALEKANNGNTAALGKLGVQMKDTEGNTLSAEAAMAKAAETYKGAAEAAVTPGQRMNVAFSELKESIGTALLPAMESLSEFMVTTLLPAFENAVKWIKENWPEIQKAFQTMWSIVEPILSTMFGFLKTQFDIISGIITVFVNLLHGDFSGAWKAVEGTIGKVWENIKTIVSNAVEFVKTTLGGIVEKVEGIPAAIAAVAVGMFDSIRDAAVTLARSVKEKVEEIVKFFLDIPKKIAGLGGKILAEITAGAGGLVGKALDVIGLAAGGIVTKPTLAIVGEAGPEAVVPLSGGVSTDRSGISPLGAMGGVSGGTVINIGTLVSSAPNVEALIADINNYARRNGGLRVPGGVTAVS